MRLPTSLTTCIVMPCNRSNVHTFCVPMVGQMSASSSCICASPSVFTVTVSTTFWRLMNCFPLERYRWRPQFFGMAVLLNATFHPAIYSTPSLSSPMTLSVTSRICPSCGLQMEALVYMPARFLPLSGLTGIPVRFYLLMVFVYRGGPDEAHPGLMPLLGVYDSLAGYWSRSSRHRSSSATVHLPIWHADVRKFVVCRTNRASSGYRFKHLFPSLWIPDLLCVFRLQVATYMLIYR